MRLWRVGSMLGSLILMVGVATFTMARPALATPPNLVVNGDFSTLDFTGWTVSGYQTDSAHLSVYSATGGPVNNGPYVQEGPNQYDYLSQNIATTAGQNYQVSFWLNYLGGSGASFACAFAGVTGFSVVGGAEAYSGWTLESFTVSAPSTSSQLMFTFAQPLVCDN